MSVPSNTRRSRAPENDGKSRSKDVFAPTKITHETILKVVRENSDSDPKWNKILNEQHIAFIKPQGKKWNPEQEENILHELARRYDDFPGQFVNLLEWLIKMKPYSNLLTEVARVYNGFTPFHLALQKRNNEFVEVVLRDYPHDSLVKILKPKEPTLNSQNCLHLAIEADSDFTLQIIAKCESLPTIFAQGNNQSNKNTPLHCAVMQTCDAKNQKMVERLIKAFDKALLKPNGEGDTPYQARMRILQRKYQKLSPMTYEDLEDMEGSVLDPSTPPNEREKDRQTEVTISMTGLNLIEETESASPSGSEEEDDDEEESESSEEEESTTEESNFMNEEDLGWEEDTAFRQEVIDDPILSLIRDYCIRKFERSDVATALYHATQERETYFNLSGRSNLSITRAYLDKLARHLKFESILKYVALPKLTVPGPGGQGYQESGESTKGLRDMEEIFQWLRDNGVKKILTAIVLDNTEPSHSDAAIENALRDFKVETWDWKKLDLNSDVIANSTNGAVQEISLYSSGNNAVLMGWASTEGLRSLEKFPRLKQVNLYCREGLEDEAKSDQYIKTFVGLLTSHINQEKENVEVTITKDDKNNSYMEGFRAHGGTGLSPRWRNRWLDDMKPFLQVVFNIPAKKADFVKIAVIDNGVDASLDSLDGKIETGASFCPIPNTTYHNPYYLTSETLSHGSMVAALICQTCPKARLYVARVNETPSSTGGDRLITAESAAQAMQWAIRKKVDVICMSWTIEKNSGQNDKGIKDLVTAITDAYAEKIIMLCSASDQGSGSKLSYPGTIKKCIRIGAATESGDRCSWVHKDDVDFIFPGENVPLKTGNDTPTKLYNGSSVATAIAAGSVGLLLYLNRLAAKGRGIGHKNSLNDLRERDDEKDAMTNAFSTMSRVNNNNCPRFSYFFQGKFSELGFKMDPDRFYEMLGGIMDQIKTSNPFYGRSS